MILSADTIRECRPVVPFIESTNVFGMSAGLSHAGYDIRVKQTVILTPDNRFCIASSIEEFSMPCDVLAIVHDKSTWARQGLSVFNTIIEPGWKGFLTLELVYHGNDEVFIYAGDPIAQIIFHRIEEAVDGYKGKYQNQPDQPVAARFDAA